MLNFQGPPRLGDAACTNGSKGGKSGLLSLFYIARNTNPVLQFPLGVIVHFEHVVIDLVRGDYDVRAFELIYVIHDESERIVECVLVVAVVDELVNHVNPHSIEQS